MVTAAASGSTTGGDDANSEKKMQASTTIAPSRHTAAYDFKKLLPIFWLGSPAKEDNGIGAMAV